jgi:hypothetical protein
MPTDTAAPTRDALIERWIHYDAVEVFVQALNNLGAYDDNETFPRSVLDGEAGEVDLGAHTFGGELWLSEDAYESPEAVTASHRSDAAVSRVFALLATDHGRDYCANQAAYYATLAAKGSR